MSPPNANRTTKPASKWSRDIRSKLITPTSYCPYQEVSNHDDYSSKCGMAASRDSFELKVAITKINISTSYAPALVCSQLAVPNAGFASG
jgi:hypothetical protein